MEREKKRFWKEAKMGLGRRTKKFQRKTFKKKIENWRTWQRKR